MAEKYLALWRCRQQKAYFNRAIVQSGPFLKSLSPDYSGRLAELVLAELGLSKSRVKELQGTLASLIVFIIPAAHLILSEVESVAADICHWF
jgi:hypothetical protein